MSDNNPLIPKEKLSAYQRWELAALGDTPKPAAAARGADNQPSSAELARIRQEAQNEGYAAGYTAGMQRAADEKTRLAALLKSLDGLKQQSEEAIADGLLDLALAIAKQMLHVALPVHRDLMLPMVREAIDQLPKTGRSGVLHLHPADVEIVQSFLREELGEHAFKLNGDARIERGGCRLDSGEGSIDATLPTRWERILSTLSRTDAWIDVE